MIGIRLTPGTSVSDNESRMVSQLLKSSEKCDLLTKRIQGRLEKLHKREVFRMLCVNFCYFLSLKFSRTNLLEKLGREIETTLFYLELCVRILF